MELLENREFALEFPLENVLGADLKASIQRPLHQRNLSLPGFRFCEAKDFLAELTKAEKHNGCPPIAVIHNGACSSTTETDPEIFRTLNVESSQKLFRYCAQKAVPFLYASSASVYGDGSLGFSDKIEKNSSYTPLNLYGKSKHDFDSWLLEQKERPPVWFGLRYFNVFGPFEEHKDKQASVFHWGRHQIRESQEIKLYRSHRDDIAHGEQKRDFVCVFDVVRVTLALLQKALSKPELSHQGRFVNIGRGRAATWLETAEALFQSLEQKSQISFIDMPKQLQEHYQNFTKADLTTLNELGITDSFLGLEEAFRKSGARETSDVSLNL